MTEIAIHNLHMRYPNQQHWTLQDLSLTVHDGELVALLGPSGSGKSTILKLIAGIERPYSGDIRIGGSSVLAVPANRRGAVLMFQKAYLFPFLSVADNIGFGLKVQHVPRATIRAEVARMLELVELPGIERKYPHQLSRGEQQRVSLARALVTRPRVLMLDEPLSSLDTAVRQTLQVGIRRIQRELGITTLLVTHDLREAVGMSDRTALLTNGMIEACDAPEQLFRRPPTLAAARFVGISTILRGRLEGTHFHSTLGTLEVAMHAFPGRPATFAIRPEELVLRTTPAPNTLPGMVVDRAFKGEFTQYQVAVAGTTIQVHSYQDQIDIAPSRTVFLQLPRDRLFEIDEQASAKAKADEP